MYSPRRCASTASHTGQCNAPDNARNGSVTMTGRAHGCKHALRRLVSPRRRERHHPMRLGECRETIADALLGLLRDLDPAIPHIDPVTLEAKQHRGRILHIDVEIRQFLRERRSEIAEAPVVEVENRVELALLHMEHGAMPPQVMDQIVAARKVSLVLVEQSDAFALTALHLHDVSDGMDTPEVCGVDLQGLPSGALRDGVVAAFLIGERSTGEDCAIAGQVPIPFRQDLFGGSTHGLGSAQPKVVEVSKPEGEQVHRMLGDDIVPDGQASIDVPGDPGIQRVHVGAFPCGGVQGHGASGASCLYSDRDVGQPVGEHREIAAETVRQSKLGVGSEGLREMLRGIGAVFQIGTQRALKAGSALRRGCGNGQSMLVPKHCISFRLLGNKERLANVHARAPA